MPKNEIIIFTDKDLSDEYITDWTNNYVNTYFGNFVIVATEKYDNFIINEEGDAYIIME